MIGCVQMNNNGNKNPDELFIEVPPSQQYPSRYRIPSADLFIAIPPTQQPYQDRIPAAELFTEVPPTQQPYRDRIPAAELFAEVPPTQYPYRDRIPAAELFIEVPPTHQYPYQDRVPAALNPMGEIYIRARVLRTLGSGNVRWWVLISGWIMFGGISLLLAAIILARQSYALIFPLAVAAIPLVSVCKGTAKKLTQSNRRSR
jgi:hypothetical protein